MNNKKTIAVDFDGTLFETAKNYPDVGAPIWNTINAVIDEQAKGTLVYLYTCRSLFHKSHINTAVEAAASVGIVFDGIIPNKPLVDLFWDDRNVNVNDIGLKNREKPYHSPDSVSEMKRLQAIRQEKLDDHDDRIREKAVTSWPNFVNKDKNA